MRQTSGYWLRHAIRSCRFQPRLSVRLLAVALSLCLLGSCGAIAIVPPPVDGPRVPPSEGIVNSDLGTISWVIHNAKTKQVLDKGTRQLRGQDIEVFDVSDSDGRFFRKRIRLNGTFDLAMVEMPEATKNEHSGFGMVARRTDQGTFSWEWFVIDDDNHATKLQEQGKLRIRLAETANGWEVLETEFLTDVSLRIERMDFIPLPDPEWRVTIREGSVIRWPSIRDGRVVKE
jgi:hypothetical protein